MLLLGDNKDGESVKYNNGLSSIPAFLKSNGIFSLEIIVIFKAKHHS